MNKKQILVFSILSLFIFNFMLSFVVAADVGGDDKVLSLSGSSAIKTGSNTVNIFSSGKALGQPCKTGFLSIFLGDGCAKGLFCNSSNTPESDAIKLGFNGKCNKRTGFNLEDFNVDGILIRDLENSSIDRILIFILVLVVMFGVLNVSGIFKTKKNGKESNGVLINLLISVAVGLLGMRGLPDDFISSIVTPASALIALIVGGIPFILVNAMAKNMINKDNDKISEVRIVWIVYALLMFGLSFYNYYQARNVATVLPLILFGAIGIFMLLTIGWRVSRAKLSEMKMSNRKRDKSNLTRTIEDLENELERKERRLRKLELDNNTGTPTKEETDLSAEITVITSKITKFKNALSKIP